MMIRGFGRHDQGSRRLEEFDSEDNEVDELMVGVHFVQCMRILKYVCTNNFMSHWCGILEFIVCIYSPLCYSSRV